MNLLPLLDIKKIFKKIKIKMWKFTFCNIYLSKNTPFAFSSYLKGPQEEFKLIVYLVISSIALVKAEMNRLTPAPGKVCPPLDA